MKTPEDMVRVRWGTMTDGLAGLMWREGLSDPVVRYRAENIVALIGPTAVIVETDPPADPPPVAPVAADAEPVATTGSDPLPDDAAADAAPVDATADAAEESRPRRRGLKP